MRLEDGCSQLRAWMLTAALLCSNVVLASGLYSPDDLPVRQSLELREPLPLINESSPIWSRSAVNSLQYPQGQEDLLTSPKLWTEDPFHRLVIFGERSMHSLEHIRAYIYNGKCEDSSQSAWPQLEFGWRLVSATVLGCIGACLCSAGGVGGGGLFVPLFNLLLLFDAKTSAALSNFMILGGSVANLAWNSVQTHPLLPDKPLIDYDVTLLLQPNMLLGISIGVICNVMFPGWLITAQLAIILSYITFRTCKSGLRLWKTETYLRAEKERSSVSLEKGKEVAPVSENGHTGMLGGEEEISPLLKKMSSKKDRHSTIETSSSFGREELNGFAEPLLGTARRNTRIQFPPGKLLTLGLVWLAFFLVQILRGGKAGKSVLNLRPCGVWYWLLSAFQLPIAMGGTVWTASHLLRPAKNPQSEDEWDRMGPRAFSLFPGMALLAGLLGGMLGIGGGMVINPLLIEIGIHPQVTAATSAFIVFFSSSMSVVQFWLLGRTPLNYAFLFASLCFVSSLVGLLVVHHLIVRCGRASIIIFSVSGVLGFSTLLMAGFGGLDVWRQYLEGDYMGFHAPC